MTVLLLLVSGSETTKYALTGDPHPLAEHPNQFQALRRNPGWIDMEVEEVLRWTIPLMHLARTSSADLVLRDQHIKQGDRMVLCYPSANRDEDVFDHPDCFDVSRSLNPYLGIGGGGVHHCLGAQLARAETACVLARLAHCFKQLEVVSPPERVASNFVGGARRAILRGALRAEVSHA